MIYLLQKDEDYISVAHLSFFYEKYKSRKSDTLLNLRLYELRASNYSKIYPEIIASNLLISSIFLLFIWVIITII